MARGEGRGTSEEWRGANGELRVQELATCHSQLASDVEVYSGHTYAERPRAFTHGGQRHEVVAVEHSWRAPGERGFRVRTTAGERWELTYDEVRDRWFVRSIDIKEDDL